MILDVEVSKKFQKLDNVSGISHTAHTTSTWTWRTECLSNEEYSISTVELPYQIISSVHFRWRFVDGELKFLCWLLSWIFLPKQSLMELLAHSNWCRSFKEVSKVRQIFRSSSYCPYHIDLGMAQEMPAKWEVLRWSKHSLSGLIWCLSSWISSDLVDNHNNTRHI